MEPQIFGNTPYALRGTALIAVLLSFAVSVCSYLMAPVMGTTLERIIDSGMLGLGVLAIIAVAILPTCLFSLRVDDTNVSHLLMGKVVLSSKPLSQLRSIEIARSFGATLTFDDGEKMRFLGARLEFLRDLCYHLQERCGGTLNVDVGAYASTLLSLGGKPRRLPDKTPERTRER